MNPNLSRWVMRVALLLLARCVARCCSSVVGRSRRSAHARLYLAQRRRETGERRIVPVANDIPVLRYGACPCNACGDVLVNYSKYVSKRISLGFILKVVCSVAITNVMGAEMKLDLQ